MIYESPEITIYNICEACDKNGCKNPCSNWYKQLKEVFYAIS